MTAEWVGAAIGGRPIDLPDQVAALVREVEDRLARGDCVQAHNAYTAYVILQLLSVTGHRPVADPFCYTRELDLELGLGMVRDKVVSFRHTQRLVFIPPLACEQIRAYRRHLKGVASMLGQKKATAAVAQSIHGLLKRGEEHLPLFFFLSGSAQQTQSITETSLTKELGRLWPYPLHNGRHWIETELLQMGVHPELIKIQLGHLEEVPHPLGATSTAVMAEVGDTLRAMLEKMALAQGWCCIEGITPSKGKIVEVKLPAHGSVHQSKLLGPEMRRRERDKTALVVKQLVEEAIRNVCGGLMTQKMEISPDERNLNACMTRLRENPSAISRVYELLVDGPHAERSLELFKRYLTLVWRMGDRMSSLSRMVVLKPELPPYAGDFIESYQSFRSMQGNFLAWLQRGRDTKSLAIETRIACVCLSAALCGRVATASRLALFTEAGKLERLSLVKQGWFWLEAPGEQADLPLWRWMPDPLTLALLSGLPDGVENSWPDQEAILVQLRQLMSSLGVEARDGDEMAALAKLAAAGATYELPGYLAAEARGDIFSQALGRATFLRMLTGLHLNRSAGAQSVPPEQEEPEWMPVTPDAIAVKPKVVEDFLKGFQSTLAMVNDVAPSGHGRSRASLKKRLSAELKKLDQDFLERPQVCSAILGWAVHLCERGTRYKRDLAINTVVKYCRTVLRPLLDVVGVKPFLRFDDDEFESVYADAIATQKSDQTRQNLASRLLEFHDYCASAWGVDLVDPGVFATEEGSSRRIDANLILPEEYAQALQELLNDMELSPRSRLVAGAMLMLGYRFGLRMGEVSRLRCIDAVVHPRGTVIYVQNSVYGETKSSSGVRIVPLIGCLSENEAEVLTQILSLCLDTQDRQALLLRSALASRVLDEEFILQRKVQQALQMVTGEPGIRFHHLRHSWANRLMIHLVRQDGGTSMAAAAQRSLAFHGIGQRRIQSDMLGPSPGPCASLNVLATMIGHLRAETTLGSYIHLLDIMHVESQVPLRRDGWKDLSVARVLGKTRNALINQRKRKGLESDASAELLRPTYIETKGWTNLSLLLSPAQDWRMLSKLNNTPPRLTLQKVEKLLSLHREGGTPRSFAVRTGLRIEEVMDLIRRGQDIETETGFKLYALTRAIDPWSGIEGAWEWIGGDQKELPRLGCGLATWSERMQGLPEEQKEALRRGLKAWGKGYREGGRKNRLIFEAKDDLEAFLGMVDVFGVSRSAFRVRVPDVSVFRNHSSDLYPLGLSDPEEAMELFAGRGDQNSSFRVSLSLRAGQGDFSYQTTLDRALFVLAVAEPHLD